MGFRKLGKLLKINHQQLQKYENGKVKPGSDRLEQIADALETNVPYLLGRTDYPGRLTADHYRIAEAFDRGDSNAILEIIRQKALKDRPNKRRLPGGNPGSKT